jgi:hypothetical protein
MIKHAGKTLWISLALSLYALACNRGAEAPKKAAPTEGDESSELVACGAATCAAGAVCCNPSCGICTAPGGMCTQQFCDELTGDAAVGDSQPKEPVTCDDIRCADGTHCEMPEVQCIRAPCMPVPECKPDAADAGR